MNAEVFWISATELDFCGRIYTWDGRCWADKNGVSRTLYLMDKGVITAGFCRWLKTSQSRLKRKDILHVYVIQGDNEGEKGDNVAEKEPEKEPDNKEGDKMRASEQLSLSSASEQLFVKPEQYEV
jgi:hypothetical protein